MARPERNNVDYFPFICKEGKTMYYIEEKYRNDGFATWIKILRQLAVTDFHYLNLSKRVDLMFLSSRCKVSEEVLLAIINDLVDMGEFEGNLWRENRVLFSVKFVDHIKDAYLKRNNKCITLQGLLTLLDGLGVRKLSKSTTTVPDNAQSKVEESKEKENKESGATKVATLETRKSDFMNTVALHIENYDKEMLRDFFEYWTEMNPNGKKLRFEMQKVFDVGRRLATWHRNEKNKNFNSSKNGTTTNRKQQHNIRLAESVINTYRDILAPGTDG